jgi:tRNA G18 (ribose-2'-O)-methylase SpoU
MRGLVHSAPHDWAKSVVWIDDPEDRRLDDYRDVRERDRLGQDGRPGLFIAESPLIVERMLARPGLAKSVLIAPGWIERIAPRTPPDVPLYVVPEGVMHALSGFPFHRGVLGVGRRAPDRERTIDRVVPRGPEPLTLLICEDVNNIDNVGLLFRNAAAFAVDAVVLSPRCHDPLYRKALRVSVGAALTVPWARSTAWPADLERLRSQFGLTLIGACAEPGTRPLGEVAAPQRVGLLVGQEYCGLSGEARRLCDHLVRIPMAPGVDSLNVAVAAAVCLHRFTRGART